MTNLIYYAITLIIGIAIGLIPWAIGKLRQGGDGGL